MNTEQSVPRIAISTDGDVLVIQGQGIPVLFIPQQYVPQLLGTPPTATAAVITDVGAAAIETVLAAGATYRSSTIIDGESIVSVTLLFTLPNGLVIAYSNDDALLAASQERVKALGIDLRVTDLSIDWTARSPLVFPSKLSSRRATGPRSSGRGARPSRMPEPT